MFRKGFVLGIIFLFVGAGVIPSTIGTIKEKIVLLNLGSRGYIQSLIDNASDGDTIYVPSGTYYENIIINKSISLIGEEKNTTIIDGGRDEDVVCIFADLVNISKFTLQNGSNGIKIVYGNSKNNINNNNIINNKESGITSDNAWDNVIINNHISNNGDGIKFVWAHNNTLAQNIICNNTNLNINLGECTENFIENNSISNSSYGMWMSPHFWDWDMNNIIANNRFYNNGLCLGVNQYGYTGDNIIENNTVNGKPLVYFYQESDRDIAFDTGQIILKDCNNISIQNQYISNTTIGIALFNTYNCYLSDNIIDSNRVGFSLWASIDNTILNNIITNNQDGIAIYGQWYNKEGPNRIINNTIFNNNNGILSKANFYGGVIIIGNTILSNGYGINIVESINNTIIGNKISSNTADGLYLSGSSGDNITGNNITNNDGNGIYLCSSNGNITGNTMVDNGIIIHGDMLEHWNTHIIDTSNTVNGKPVIYWKNQTGGTIPTDAGQVILANCTNIVVENQNINNGSGGIQLGFSSGCTITSNHISSNNEDGIELSCSSSNTITYNTIISNNVNGIYLWYSSGNNITGNHISSNTGDGLYIYYSSSNTITDNNITNNYGDGIYLYSSKGNNIITGNNITNNDGNGIYLWYSSGNNNIIFNNITNNHHGIYLKYSSGNNITGNNILNNNGIGIHLSDYSDNNFIYLNNFIDNTQNALDEGDNTWDWDDGKKGNYWDDYKEKYPNAHKIWLKGVWDTPYNITGGDNKDNFPLIKPFTKPRNRTVNLPFQNLLEHYKILFLILQLLISRLGQ
jgi:parallel beta-helix repeat protein